MRRKPDHMHRGIRVLAVILLLEMAFSLSAAAVSSKIGFDSLAARLIADGFDRKKITHLYHSGKVNFDDKGLSLFFRHNESKLNYDQFLSPKNLKAARSYIKTHEPAFRKTEEKFGVDRHVIAAIILVETRLGRFLGNRNVLTTLSSMAALQDPVTRTIFWDRITRENRLSRKHFEKKADRRSAWAYRELSAFLTYAFREHLEPSRAMGSYAGAMGICQFMPSNLLAYGADGNGDTRVDPYDHADAIASIGRYLKHFGWHADMERKAAYKVVWHYNRSNYYVDTVLRIADRL